LRAKYVRSLKKAENRIHKSRGPIPEKFGDQVTLDHIIARNEGNRGFKGRTSALTFTDRATGFRWGRHLRQKTGGANLEVVRKFQRSDPADKIKYVWSDAAPEISFATAKMGIRGNYDTSVPRDSQREVPSMARWEVAWPDGK
jgi:hypothetical protein